MPVTVLVDLYLKEEHVDDALAGLARDLPDTRAFDGNMRVETVRDQAQPGHVVLIERWENRSDQERYIAWRQESGSLEGMAAISTAAPTFTYYDELPEV